MPEKPVNPADSTTDDATLVSRSQAGDRQAFSDLYDRHAPHVYSLARRILRCDADAEAVVSDVFLKLWRSPERFNESRGSLRTYLLVLARSRSIDQVRAQTTRDEHATAALVQSDNSRRDQESDETPPRQVIRSEHSRLVREAAQKLDPRQRVPLVLAYFDGLTHREIAARLDQPLGTVKTRIRAGLQSLQSTLRSLGRHDDELS